MNTMLSIHTNKHDEQKCFHTNKHDEHEYFHTNKRDKHECSQSTIYSYIVIPLRHGFDNHQHILLMHGSNHYQYTPLMHRSNHHQYIPLMHEFNNHQYIPLMHGFNIQSSKNLKTLFIINIISKHYYSYFKSKLFAISCLIYFQKTITCKQSLKYSTRVLNNL